MKIPAEGFEFDFNDENVLDAFVFDEENKTKSTFHGLSHAMQAVDIIVELENNYLFIEIKKFYNPKENKPIEPDFKEKKKDLKYKYRDTWIYRWAENKIDKPIHYICLLTPLDNALLTKFQNDLKCELPVVIPKKISNRWQSKIVESCQVVDVAKWNTNFPKWPVRIL